jgi:sulfonate transport system substrate-binding protein
VLVKNAAEISDPANRKLWSAEMAQQSQIPQALFLEELQPQDLNFRTSPRIDPFLTDSFGGSIEQAKAGRLIRNAFAVTSWADGQFVERALKTLQLENHWPQYDSKGQANAG